MDSSYYSGKVRKEPNRIYSWELIWTFVSILDLSELKEKWLKKKKKKKHFRISHPFCGGKCEIVTLRKKPTFRDATTCFPAKWRLRNERRNSILMTRHYPDLGSASDWLNQISHAARPIRSTTQIWEVTRHQYEISALVSQTSFGGEISGSVAKCRLFSQASEIVYIKLVFKSH